MRLTTGSLESSLMLDSYCIFMVVCVTVLKSKEAANCRERFPFLPRTRASSDIFDYSQSSPTSPPNLFHAQPEINVLPSLPEYCLVARCRVTRSPTPVGEVGRYVVVSPIILVRDRNGDNCRRHKVRSKSRRCVVQSKYSQGGPCP